MDVKKDEKRKIDRSLGEERTGATPDPQLVFSEFILQSDTNWKGDISRRTGGRGTSLIE